jgi:hypothetical protein
MEVMLMLQRFHWNLWSKREILTKITTYPNKLSKKTTSQKYCQNGPPLCGGRACQPTCGACRRPLWRQALPPFGMAARLIELNGRQRGWKRWALPPRPHTACCGACSCTCRHARDSWLGRPIDWSALSFSSSTFFLFSIFYFFV